jgi:Mrp family chromosome partitioning ATPase
LAAVAIFIKVYKILPFEDSYVVTGKFSTPLLPDVVSIYDLQSTVASVQFQGAVGAQVAVEPLPDDAHQFRLVVRHAILGEAEESFPEAAELLKAKLKSLAVSEVDSSRAFVEELQREERERKELTATDRPADRLEAALSEEDGQRAILLRKEIQDLKGFLNGGKAPGWLRAEIQRDSVTRAEKRVQNAKSELLRLSTVFQSDSDPVRAQADLVRKALAEKAEIERHIAKVLLDSHRAELKRLEDKSVAIVKANAKQTDPKPEEVAAKEGPEASESLLWLREHSHKLDEKAQRLERQARLTVTEKPSTAAERPSGYWASMALWAGSVLFLLAALFVEAGPQRERGAVATEPKRLSLDRRDALQPPAQVEMPTSPAPEAFFQSLQQKLEQAMGGMPSRVLLLGSSPEERSSLALRLAKNFSSSGHTVRLVDFDLQDRPLSQRIGDESSPGVGDLLTCAGPVEEFFASVPGTSIQFAPAGTLRVLREPVCQATVERLLRQPRNGVTLVDASFSSPLHLLVGQLDAVLCLTAQGNVWSQQEEQVLLGLREARVPIWGLTRGGAQFFPFI